MGFRYIASYASLLFSLMVVACLLFARDGAFVGDTEKYDGFLASKIPLRIGGMAGVDKPLGNTEEVIRASEKVLNVSDFLNREYTTASGIKFTLYISYWSKNKERITNASSHTPDRCWVKNGWKNRSGKAKVVDSLAAGGKKLMPAYYREYSIETGFGEERRNVYYWFVADGKHYDFGKNKSSYIPNPWVWLKSGLFIGSPEMYFIRLDSSSDMSLILEDGDAQKLLEYLGGLAIYRK